MGGYISSNAAGSAEERATNKAIEKSLEDVSCFITSLFSTMSAQTLLLRVEKKTGRLSESCCWVLVIVGSLLL